MYLSGFDSTNDIARKFNLVSDPRTPDQAAEISSFHPLAVDVIAAVYQIDGYEGQAFIVFAKDGKLYEVNASHCSCNGLEGQWSPEETAYEALEHRANQGRLNDIIDWAKLSQLIKNHDSFN